MIGLVVPDFWVGVAATILAEILLVVAVAVAVSWPRRGAGEGSD